MHYDRTVGCEFEAPLKGGGLQQLDRVQGHRDSVTHCHQGLNLKVGKMNPHLGNPDPISAIWAKCLESGQNFSRSGQFFLFIFRCKICRSLYFTFICTPHFADDELKPSRCHQRSRGRGDNGWDNSSSRWPGPPSEPLCGGALLYSANFSGQCASTSRLGVKAFVH